MHSNHNRNSQYLSSAESSSVYFEGKLPHGPGDVLTDATVSLIRTKLSFTIYFEERGFKKSFSDSSEIKKFENFLYFHIGCY